MSVVRGLGFTRKRLAVSLRAALAGLHASAVGMSDDPSTAIPENVLNAGLRYLKGDKEELRENLRKRKANLSVDKMVRSNRCCNWSCAFTFDDLYHITVDLTVSRL